MNKVYSEIEITSEDLKKVIYFIFMKYKSDMLHQTGTSSKSDSIGGFIDRWVNRISEFVVFDHLLKGRNYKVSPDYFLYDNQSEKDASDLLGLEDKFGKVIPFIKFNDGTWKRVDDLPKVEIKTVKRNQYLAGVRDTQMDDDYYVFVESNLDSEYLASLFSRDIFDDSVFKEIDMNKEDFIERDPRNLLISPFRISKPTNIGTLRLIGTYLKDDFLSHTVLFVEKEPLRYLKKIEKITTLSHVGRYLLKSPSSPNIKDGSFVNSLTTIKSLPIFVSNNNFQILGGSQSTIYIDAHENIKINGLEYPKGKLKLSYAHMERDSNWREYMAGKDYLRIACKDRTDELIERFDSIYKSYTNQE